MRLSALFLACALVLSGRSTPNVVVLDDDMHAVVEHFNDRSDHLRFLAILSPT